MQFSNYSIIYKNLLNIIKASFFQFLAITFLVSFLLFLLNMFLGISYNVSHFTNDLQHKLGIYFYIKDVPEQKDEIYSKIIDMKGKLEDAGLKVEYYSKEDALKLLEKRMPEVIKNFQKYGIENPLPPTLYIIFDSKDKYDRLKDVMSGYNDIIVNFEDISKGKTFTDQESRIINVINFTNFIIMFAYFLIIILVMIILAFLLFGIKNNFNTFYKQIEIEKLLGAYYWQIKLPFIINILLILVISSACIFIYFSVFINLSEEYFLKVFSINIWSYISSNKDILIKLFMGEFIFLILLSSLISNFFLNRLLRKV